MAIAQTTGDSMFWKKKKQNMPDPGFREFQFSELKPGEIYHAEGILPQYKGRSVKHTVACYDLRELERIRQSAERSSEAKRLGVLLHVEPGYKQVERNKELIQLAHRAERRILTKQLIWDLFLTTEETHCVKMSVQNGGFTFMLLHVNVNLKTPVLSPGIIRQQAVQGKTGEQWVGINIKVMRMLSRLLIVPYEEMLLRDPSGEDTTILLNSSEIMLTGNFWAQQSWLTALISAYSSFARDR